MKLLFDQNLSFRLVERLANIFPNSSHVRFAGLEKAADEVVWNYAMLNDFTIVTKDDDFDQRMRRFGWPPKVIWINVGNCTTQLVEDQLRGYLAEIRAFYERTEDGMLIIGRAPVPLQGNS